MKSRTAIVAPHLNKVANVLERARLAAIAIDCQRLALHNITHMQSIKLILQ